MSLPDLVRGVMLAMTSLASSATLLVAEWKLALSGLGVLTLGEFSFCS